MMKRFFYGILVILAILAGISSSAPEPVVLQNANEWTLNTEFTHPQSIVIWPEPEQPVLFWYTIITITNNSRQDVDLYLQCDLMTDTFQIIPEGKNATPMVFERIKERHQSRYPFIESIEQADNIMLQGEDNAKDIAIIWPDFDHEAKSITIFIKGLSNETAVFDHPIEKDEYGQPTKVYLRKTLELSYDVKVDPSARSGVKVEFTEKRWIMR